MVMQTSKHGLLSVAQVRSVLISVSLEYSCNMAEHWTAHAASSAALQALASLVTVMTACYQWPTCKRLVMAEEAQRPL